jgi:hypothetical protein
MSDTASTRPQHAPDLPPTDASRARAMERMIPTTPIARFADGLLGADLPALAPDRRRAAVDFIGRRVEVLPSITRFGVLVIARTVDLVAMLIGRDRTRRAVVRLPVPLLAEYPRLVRSLGYAYVWESWPDTLVDGGSPG